MDKTLTILGIDAGFVAPGLALVRDIKIKDGTWTKTYGTLVFADCFRPKVVACKSVTAQHVHRICAVADKIKSVVNEYKPDIVAVELPSGGARGASAIRGMAYATALTTATLYTLGAEMYPITPQANKKASTGDINAEKEDVVVGISRYWEVCWPQLKTKSKVNEQDSWAMADALSAILTFLHAKHADGYLDRLARPH